jgi:tetratricopeptide (TPR) repeat protein
MAWIAAAAGAAAAAPEETTPYDFRVILRVAPHGLLTKTFRRQLRDELQDALQAALGPIAQVEVQDAAALPRDAWLDPAALDGQSAVGPAKRHFVEVAFADGRYVVRTRQLDGSTGLASPVVREARTADRAFVGRLITRFIDQDFGPVGTVVGYDKATDRAELALRGGGLASGDLARWVPAGSVFALARVEGAPPRGRAVDSAYLVTLAEPKDGRCECRFVYRFQDQLADWSAVTYRALKLGTGQGPVRLRVTDRNGLPPSGLQVRISPDGFRPTDPARDQGAIRNGVFDTTHAYDRIAFALVTSGEQKVAQVPVPVIDDRVTAVRVVPAAGGEARQQLEMDARNVHQRLLDIIHRLQVQNRRVGQAADQQRHAEALADVKRGLDVLDGDLNVLAGELARLRRDTGRVESNAGPLLEQGDLYMREIRKRRDTLLQWQDDLAKAVKEEKDQEPLRDSYLALLRRAAALQEEAEFGEAIKVYKEILDKHGERVDVRKKLDDLEAAWKIKTPEQGQARAFAYGPWARVKTAEDVRTNLPKAREALEACKQAGDRLTALKLFLAATAAADVMVKAVEELEKSESDIDRTVNLAQAQKVTEELQAFIKDVSGFIRSEEKP